ncbi:hypothetical protein SAMN05216600_113124 [Pseudomonas cuatrocienegasensis]|uniref:Uncharacterized protein n=1 Tax=Pseudomonas cuatrocienegasensis TaxID=543360 RepID=A0ABY1BJY4_9PSED|nr:hypothetical protein A7D25_23155 [Pseudomonas sp. 21C1]SER02510.1 hypothetical protein SAMN05216600_113124 [Pseudomonas cuatrocienegasensis]
MRLTGRPIAAKAERRPAPPTSRILTLAASRQQALAEHRRVDDASPVHHCTVAMVDKKSVVHPTFAMADCGRHRAAIQTVPTLEHDPSKPWEAL